MSKAKRIVAEIMEKVEDYETDQSGFLSAYNGWADLYRVRRPALKSDDKVFSNPQLTEMHRATETLATMMYRMSTAQEPNFETVAMEYEMDPELLFDKLNAIEATQRTQLEACDFNQKLLRAYRSLVLFGTVFVEENYRLIGMSPFGRVIPVTDFQPRSMLQVSFDRGCLDLDDADWVATEDLYSPAGLMGLARDADKLGQEWNKAALEEAAKDKHSRIDDINEHIRNRLIRNGYSTLDKMNQRKVLTFYRGKFDTMNDGIEYVAAVVDGKHLVRFHANNFQHGMRQMRIAKWVDFELEARGLGLGDLFANKHREMTANMRRITDGFAFNTYNVWKVLRGGGVDSNDIQNLTPFSMVEMDDMNALQPMPGDIAGPANGLKLHEMIRQDFRAASGATDQLQGIVSEAQTLGEASLAQNESIRRLSVLTEMAAHQLIRKHLMVQHYNNVQNIKERINVNFNGRPKHVYPVDLKLDVDFKLRIVTDRDFKPKRTETLLQTLQILTSIRNDNPQKFEINVLPFALELAKSLGIPPSQVVRRNKMQDMGQPTGVVPPAGQAEMMAPGSAPGIEPGLEGQQTQLGPVLGSA